MERRLRIAAIVLVFAWFLVPGLRSFIPPWLVFLVFAALELQFLVAGWRERGLPRGPRGRAPQQVDLERYGGAQWREPVLARIEGFDVWLGRGEPAPAEPAPSARLPGLEGVVLLALLALVLFVLLPARGWSDVGADDRARTEARLSAEAARIAGHPARIRCDDEGKAVGVVQHADGIAEVGGTNALLTPAICFRLYRLAFEGDEGPFGQTARAIAVLAHEAWHLRGERNEGVTNCYAFQSGVELGRRLGLSESTAARMMSQQLAENATFARASPAYLVPAACRDGGTLDLNPGSNRFP